MLGRCSCCSPRRRRARSPATTSPVPTRPCWTQSARANDGHAPAYGDDPWTAACERRLPGAVRSTSRRCSRSTAPAPTCSRWRRCSARPRPSCARTWSHIAVDETGAPERILGAKLIDLPSARRQVDTGPGRERQAHLVGSPHHAQPGVVSITQSTELGTLYTADEVAGDLRRGPPPRHAGPHGRRADRQRHGGSRRRRRHAAGADHRRRRRRAHVRRHEERPARRRGGRLPPARAGVPRPSTCASRSPSCRRRCASWRPSSRRCSTDDLWLDARRPRQRDGLARCTPPCPGSPGSMSGLARRSTASSRSCRPTSSPRSRRGASSGTGTSPVTRCAG